MRNQPYVGRVTSTNSSVTVAWTVDGDSPSKCYAYDAPNPAPNSARSEVPADPQGGWSKTRANLAPGTQYEFEFGFLFAQTDTLGEQTLWTTQFASTSGPAPAPPKEQFPPPALARHEQHAKTSTKPNSITVWWSSARIYDKFVIRYELDDVPGISDRNVEVNSSRTDGSANVATAAGRPYHFFFQGVVKDVYKDHDIDSSPFSGKFVVNSGPNHTTLRSFLDDSGIAWDGESLRTLFAGATSSLRSYLGD